MKLIWKFMPPVHIAGTDRFLSTVESGLSSFELFKMGLKFVWFSFYTLVFINTTVINHIKEPDLAHKGTHFNDRTS